MESIVVEAIRQLPALILAVLVIYFYRTAKRAAERNDEMPVIPDDLLQNVESTRSRTDQLESRIGDLAERLEAYVSREEEMEDDAEAVRSQLTNQKMALKEFGRVLSKTSEQTYTEFSAIDERLRAIEDALGERDVLNDENRSAAA